MTALKEYQRLEATAIWYGGPDAQRLDAIVTLGTATLTIVSTRNVALAHWSLAALERRNPGKRPAVYTASADSEERVEIEDDTMVRAIEKVRRAVDRTRPHPGRLRSRLTWAAVIGMAALAVLWLPQALVRYTASVVPEAARAALGADIFREVTRVSGRPCNTAQGVAALNALTETLAPYGLPNIVVVPDGVQGAVHLPGGLMLLNRAVVEDHETPHVVAGYILTEAERAAQSDPLQDLLRQAGLRATLTLVTTGKVPADTLGSYAEYVLTAPAPMPATEPLLARFSGAGVPAAPFAYALDISGETTLPMIEADPVSVKDARTLLPDDDWVALQGICGD